MFELDAYLSRIGLSGRPELAAIHRAHVVAIPFENLDPHRGVPVALDIEALQDKLVQRRRGGYCFEHNSLLKAALEALGARAEPMLARVRWGNSPDHVSPLTHLVLRVTIEGATWLADVGFGQATLLEPIPFGPGGPYEQSGWRYRVTGERDELVLQCETSAGWRDVYAFLPRPVQAIDVEVSNWFTCTRPSSGFVRGLIVTATRACGARVSLSDWSVGGGEGLELVTRTPAGSSVTEVTRAQVPELLREQFGLEGFELDGEGRVTLASQPSN